MKKAVKKCATCSHSVGLLSFDMKEEREDFEAAQKAGGLVVFVWDMLQELRSGIKYGESGITKMEGDGDMEKVRAWMYRELSERGLLGVVEH